MRTCSSVLAVARAPTLRLPRASLASRLISLIALLQRAVCLAACSRRSCGHLAVHAGEALLQRLEVEIGERLAALRDVEEAVQQVRARTGPRHRDHPRRRIELARHDVGDVVKGGGNAGDGIERTGAAIEQDA